MAIYHQFWWVLFSWSILYNNGSLTDVTDNISRFLLKGIQGTPSFLPVSLFFYEICYPVDMLGIMEY